MSPGTVPLPGGTVAVLSAGLVGSALLNQRLGDEVARGVNEDWAFLSNFDLFQNAITSAVEDGCGSSAKGHHDRQQLPRRDERGRMRVIFYGRGDEGLVIT